MDLSNETISALNSAAGYAEGARLRPSAAQRAVLERIVEAHMLLGPPPAGLTREASFREMLAPASPYAAATVPAKLGSYVRELVSRPAAGTHAVPLEDLLSGTALDHYTHFTSRHVLKGAAAAPLFEKQAVLKPYWDPILGQGGKAYEGFVEDLHESGMLAFTSQPSCAASVFFVKKKDGRLRLIVDARVANRQFSPPPSGGAAAGDAFARIELPPGAELFTAQCDVKDFFYHLSVDPSLGRYFALRPLRAGPLLERFPNLRCDGRLPSPTEWITPHFSVLPMGFSWAMYFAQQVHDTQLLKVPCLCEKRFIQPSRPLPAPDGAPGPLVLAYADNGNFLHVKARVAQEGKDAAVQQLRASGLLVHEEVDATRVVNALGVTVDGARGRVVGTQKRVWRLRMALQHLFRHPFASGRQLEVLVGHLTFLFLIERKLLSLLSAVYVYIRKCYDVTVRLWSSVLEELRHVYHLLPLCSADLRAPWITTCTAYDASKGGYGICTSELGAEEVAALGGWDDRWRFAFDGPVRPRDALLSDQLPEGSFVRGDFLSDPDTVLSSTRWGDWQPPALVESFPEVPTSLLSASRWQVAKAGPWRYCEPIHRLEGRALCLAVRRLARRCSCHGGRHVLLGDNLGLVLAMQKGRAHDFRFLMVVRRVQMIALAAGLRLAHRWIPSERNPADAASRGRAPAATRARCAQQPEGPAPLPAADARRLGLLWNDLEAALALPEPSLAEKGGLEAIHCAPCPGSRAVRTGGPPETAGAAAAGRPAGRWPSLAHGPPAAPGAGGAAAPAPACPPAVGRRADLPGGELRSALLRAGLRGADRELPALCRRPGPLDRPAAPPGCGPRDLLRRAFRGGVPGGRRGAAAGGLSLSAGGGPVLQGLAASRAARP